MVVIEENNNLESCPVLTEKELEELNSAYSSMVEYFSKLSKNIIPETNFHVKWLKKGLEYNVDHKGKTCGVLVAATYKIFAKEMKPNELKLAYQLGWILEILDTRFKITDEVMKGQEIRQNGKPCWFRKKEVDMIAINDGFLYDMFALQSLRHVLQDFNPELYLELNDFIVENTRNGLFGRSIASQVVPKVNCVQDALKSFTMENYRLIVKYKWSLCKIFMPVGIGLTLAKKNKEVVSKIKEILLEVGLLLQVQEDYNAFFGDKNELGDCSEVLKDKNNWCLFQALELCDIEEAQELLRVYRKEDLSSLQILNELYEKLNLHEKFVEFKKETKRKIEGYIFDLPGDQNEYRELIRSIYKIMS